MKSKLLALSLLALGMLLSGVRGFAAAPAAGEWKVTFTHKAGKAAVDFSSAANKQALAELDNIARTQGGRIASIEVKSYSSPEGRLAWNTKLAGLRSEGVKKMVEELMGSQSYPDIRENNVPEDWDAAKAYLRLTDKPWKEEALKIIDAGGESRKEKMEDLWAGDAWDDLIWNCFYAVRRTEVVFTFAPNFEISEGSEPVPASELSVKFAVGSTSVAHSYLDNAANLAALESLANTVVAGRTVVLDAYSSPEGRASWNLVLARRRAEAVKAYLVSRGVAPSAIEIRTVQEDWAGLAEGVDSSWFGTDKEQILAIARDSSLDSATKEARLRALGGGQVWNRLLASQMQDLRRVDVRLE